MAAAEILNQSGDDKLAALLEKVTELAVLPHVVFKVLEITGTEDSPAQDIERVVTVDPGFSSKVLVLANSAGYGVPRRVTTIKDAVMYLGFKAVRNIALTVGVFDLFVGKTDKESLRRRAWWRLSIDTAICARWLASKCKGILPDEAYTCGLLHLIGKTLLDRVGGEDYDKVMQVGQMGVPDIMAEIKLYGVNHVQLGSAAAAKWGLPAEVQSGITYTVPSKDDDPAGPLRACTALASRIAACATHGAEAQKDQMVPTWVLERLGLSDADVDALFEGGMSAIAAAQAKS